MNFHYLLLDVSLVSPEVAKNIVACWKGLFKDRIYWKQIVFNRCRYSRSTIIYRTVEQRKNAEEPDIGYIKLHEYMIERTLHFMCYFYPKQRNRKNQIGASHPIIIEETYTENESFVCESHNRVPSSEKQQHTDGAAPSTLTFFLKRKNFFLLFNAFLQSSIHLWIKSNSLSRAIEK